MKIAISSSELLLEVRCIKALSELLVLGVGLVQRQFLSPTNMRILLLLRLSEAASPNCN